MTGTVTSAIAGGAAKVSGLAVRAGKAASPLRTLAGARASSASSYGGATGSQELMSIQMGKVGNAGLTALVGYSAKVKDDLYPALFNNGRFNVQGTPHRSHAET